MPECARLSCTRNLSDGTRLVYVSQAGNRTLPQTRDMTTGRVSPLAGTEGGHTAFFSPDGGSIGFFADGKLKRLSSGGGSMITLMRPCPTAGVVGAPMASSTSPDTCKKGLQPALSDHSPGAT